jgi:hypothetical protein
MHTHNHDDGQEPEEIDASQGYEQSDAHVTGIITFLVSLAAFVVVSAVLSYGIGKVINAHLTKEDGPTNKWATTADVRQLGNLPNNPEMQNKMAEMTQQFPAPRLQTDDGNQDIADLHAREDLLLSNYTWVDQSKGTIRIPIERAMEMIVQQGLPVAKPVQTQAEMTGDSTPTVTAPLTNGFARTAFEQDEAEQEATVKAEQTAK